MIRIGNNRRSLCWAFADRNYSSIRDQPYMMLWLNIWLRRRPKKILLIRWERVIRKKSW